MSKRKSKPRPAETLSEGSSSARAPAPLTTSAAIRETIESVVIAFVLAFLFRTFEAEAFVIPTGSMAPTLMGQHKDLVCPECGHPFRVSASSEVQQETNRPTGMVVEQGTCPMCRFDVDLRKDRPLEKGEERQYYPSYKGDRILVGKSAYEFQDPDRWDVAVFHWPGGAEVNFIKRLVGLPHETVRIERGDIWVRPDGGEGFSIARKPPQKLEAMLQLVYDNDYQAKSLVAAGFPQRWQADTPSQAGSWQPSDDHRSFSTDGSSDGATWLHYRHLVPTSSQWEDIRASRSLREPIRPELISDFCAYNTHIDVHRFGNFRGHSSRPGRPDASTLGLHWVGDLAAECTLEVRSRAGLFYLELVEGGRRFRASFDLASGQATLAILGENDFGATAATAVRGPGTYRLRFANVDNELTLWVNGKPVAFDQPTAYEPLGNSVPTQADLAPVAVGSDHASLEVRNLRVLRDLYYIAMKKYSRNSDFDESTGPYARGVTEDARRAFLTDPRQWTAYESMAHVDFPLEADQFLMLGDNSARSKDSRLWEGPPDLSEYYVRRDLLIGKALFVYWPHSWNRLPGTDIPFPLFPNFERMEFVR